MVEFLYPRSRQFPFDEVCSKIVYALEARNWQVPGITVDFHVYGSGQQNFRAVEHIRGRDFKIWFCRVQRTIPGGHWNDIAAVSEIVIPEKELNVYEDESGPTFYLYVGGDWERDREKFMQGCKVNSKLAGKPKMYLLYKGECRCYDVRQSWGKDLPHTHPGQRPPLLVHTNDLGREYDPEGEEPTFFFTNPVMEEFRGYLESVVLRSIMSHPIPEGKVDMFPTPEPIPFPEAIGALFCFADYRDTERIKQGKADPTKLELADRYGLQGNGRRLVSLGTPNDGTVPEIAYEGFLWCGIGEVTAETAIESLKVPGHYRSFYSERFVIRVKPNRANDIYVADHALYEARAREVWQAAGDRGLTDNEVATMVRARARSIVPISEYRGNYGEPVVLIRRELSFDEVEVVSGPHEDR
jgi:hypothetical protein